LTLVDRSSLQRARPGPSFWARPGPFNVRSGEEDCGNWFSRISHSCFRVGTVSRRCADSGMPEYKSAGERPGSGGRRRRGAKVSVLETDADEDQPDASCARRLRRRWNQRRALANGVTGRRHGRNSRWLEPRVRQAHPPATHEPREGSRFSSLRIGAQAVQTRAQLQIHRRT
jgi:hypothetical protein